MGESFQKTAANSQDIAHMGTSQPLPLTGNASECWENQVNGIDSFCGLQAEELELSLAADGILEHVYLFTLDDSKSFKPKQWAEIANSAGVNFVPITHYCRKR
jgi:hypothetical protein